MSKSLGVGKIPSAIVTTAGLAIVSLILTAVVAFALSRPTPSAPKTIGAYATDLRGRTPHQQFNARRASEAIDGIVIQPGAEFSFNKAVGGWAPGRGYLKAPVSFNGVLIDDYGGGVCEASTTIYNAALLTGLTIVERHAHTFSPSYAPAGRDAAVAYPGIDLRFKNPYSYPVTIHVRQSGHMLLCQFTGRTKIPPSVEITSQTVQVIHAPSGFIGRDTKLAASRWHMQGRDGFHVLVFRTVGDDYNPGIRYLISDNTYLPLSAIRRSPG